MQPVQLIRIRIVTRSRGRPLLEPSRLDGGLPALSRVPLLILLVGSLSYVISLLPGPGRRVPAQIDR
jgi:hypothetical protein